MAVIKLWYSPIIFRQVSFSKQTLCHLQNGLSTSLYLDSKVWIVLECMLILSSQDQSLRHTRRSQIQNDNCYVLVVTVPDIK